MTICRLKPDHNVCCSCIDEQVDAGKKKDCDKCPEYLWVELLQLGATIFGRNYAFVTGPSTNWTIEKVDAKRLGCCVYIIDKKYNNCTLQIFNDYIKENASTGG